MATTKGGESASTPDTSADAAFEPRLADPGRSRAVLIDGTDTGAAQALADVLGDRTVWGLPRPNRTVMERPAMSDAWRTIQSASAASTDALIVCFRGTAIQGTGVGWQLALDSSATATLQLTDVLDAMSQSRAGLRLLVLDCALSLKGLPSALTAGTVVIVAAPPRVDRRSRPPETQLCRALASALADGDADEPELLTVEYLLAELARSVPRSSSAGTGSRVFALARNRAHPEPPPPPSSHHVPWQHDTPATRDLLQREALAEILGTRLRRAHAEAPGVSFLVHVDGQWGAGKSTLLNLLAADLDRDFLVVDFNAWRHSRVQPTWFPLLTAVRDRVVRSGRWFNFRFLRLRETWMRIRYAGASWLLPMAATSAVIIAGVLALRSNWAGSGAVVGVVTPAVAVAGLIWAASRVAARLFLWDSARGARIFEQSHTDPMGEVAHHFAWLLKRSRRPVVIFIDDLDRCDQATVVETLEVVQNLIRESPAARGHSAASFVVSADGAWLRCAFEGNFEAFKSAIDEPGRPLGYLFQDKLFQLSVPLRFLTAENQSSYIERLLATEDSVPEAPEPGVADTARRIAGATSEAEVVGIMLEAPEGVRTQVAAQAAVKMAEPDITKSTEHALLKFAHLLQPNPRGIKRFLNTYSTLRTLRTLEAGEQPDVDTLAAWAIVRSRWPQLADELEARPELLDELRAGGGGGAVSVEVRGFLAAVELTGREVRVCSGNRPGASLPTAVRGVANVVGAKDAAAAPPPGQG